MPFKPMPVKKYLQYLRLAGWRLEKGGIDWNLYSETGQYMCSIKIAHGKRTKEEIVAASVRKTEKAFQQKGVSWPPKKR